MSNTSWAVCLLLCFFFFFFFFFNPTKNYIVFGVLKIGFEVYFNLQNLVDNIFGFLISTPFPIRNWHAYNTIYPHPSHTLATPNSPNQPNQVSSVVVSQKKKYLVWFWNSNRSNNRKKMRGSRFLRLEQSLT